VQPNVDVARESPFLFGVGGSSSRRTGSNQGANLDRQDDPGKVRRAREVPGVFHIGVEGERLFPRATKYAAKNFKVRSSCARRPPESFPNGGVPEESPMADPIGVRSQRASSQPPP